MKRYKKHIYAWDVYYDQYADVSYYYEYGICVAQLDHGKDIFEPHQLMTQEQMDFYYAEMLKEKETYES
jgi:hypothetical protein